MNTKKTAYMVVDVESTSTDRYTAEIFDIAIIVIDEFQQTISIYNSYIKIPEELIDQTIQELGHIIHIDKAAIMAAKDHHQISEEIYQFINNLKKQYQLKFVAHNASFDYQMMSEMYRRYNKEQHLFFIETFNTQDKTIIDTINLIRSLYPNIKKYSLNNIAKVLNIAPQLINQRTRHNALLDCKILVELLFRVMNDQPFIKI